jgi:hypothetical protein
MLNYQAPKALLVNDSEPLDAFTLTNKKPTLSAIPN